MEEKLDLSRHFPPVSKNEWIKRIEKDLKGRSYEELRFAVSREITLDPLYHREDHEKLPTIELLKESPGWEIAERIDAADPATANSTALQALNYGAESLLFEHFERTPILEDLTVLLKDVKPEYISLGFSLSQGRVSAEALLVSLKKYLEGVKALNCRLFLEEVKSDVNEAIFNRVLELGKAFPGSRLFQVDLRPVHQDGKDPAGEVSEGLKKGLYCLERMKTEANPRSLFFSLYAGKDYFTGMAKLRALRWLWPKVQAAAGLSEAAPAFLQVETAPGAYTEDTYTNMIYATTLAMSAITGGADRLFVLPADSHTEKTTPFTSRIARNVQHILRLESHFDKVTDPAAGSYFIDQLTREIAKTAWEKI